MEICTRLQSIFDPDEVDEIRFTKLSRGARLLIPEIRANTSLESPGKEAYVKSTP